MKRDGTPDTAEHRRLAEATGRAEDDLFDANPWYEWGPYLSERAWGTVREDYSDNGDAWRSFPHDHARSRSYRWNEDGMAGLSDIRHELCLGVAADLADRLVSIWLPDGNGRRPVNGRYDVLDLDPAWSDHLQFFEYFHGDLGIGLGASHQTGWTALVVDLIIDPPGVRPGEHP